MNRSPFENSSLNSFGQSRNDTLTIHVTESFSDEMNSVVSALTLEDELCTISDQSQFRLDRILISIDERRWTSDPTIKGSKSLNSHRYDRFSSCSEHGNKKMCPIPKRRLSMEIQSPLSNKETTRDLGFYKEFNAHPDIVSACSTENTFADSSLELFDIYGDRSRQRNGPRLVRH